ncbi:8005_t:CDS:1, partial [Funneliformis geosporum]
RNIASQTSQDVLQRVLIEDFKFAPVKNFLISSRNAAPAR